VKIAVKVVQKYTIIKNNKTIIYLKKESRKFYKYIKDKKEKI